MKAMNLTRWLKGVNEVVVKNLDISINQKSAVMTIEKMILHRAKKNHNKNESSYNRDFIAILIALIDLLASVVADFQVLDIASQHLPKPQSILPHED